MSIFLPESMRSVLPHWHGESQVFPVREGYCIWLPHGQGSIPHYWWHWNPQGCRQPAWPCHQLQIFPRFRNTTLINIAWSTYEGSLASIVSFSTLHTFQKTNDHYVCTSLLAKKLLLHLPFSMIESLRHVNSETDFNWYVFQMYVHTACLFLALGDWNLFGPWIFKALTWFVCPVDKHRSR